MLPRVQPLPVCCRAMEAPPTSSGAASTNGRSRLITVAIPTRDRADLLPRAIESALSQTAVEVEVIVLDDASDDDTTDVVSSYADSGVVHIRHEVPLGMVGNWNQAFHVGSGDAIAILHDDDYWAPHFLDRCAASYFDAEERPGFVYAQYVPVNARGVPLRGPLLSLPEKDVVLSSEDAVLRLVQNDEPGWPCVLWDRASVLDVGGFAEGFPYHVDWQLWIRLAAVRPVGYVGETLGYWVQHGDQFSAKFARDPLAVARDRYAMLRSTIPDLPLPAGTRADLLDSAMRSLAETQIVDAWDLARDGLRRASRMNIAYAFRIDPAILMRSPHLVGAAYAGSILPARVLRRLDSLRSRVRPVFRRY